MGFQSIRHFRPSYKSSRFNLGITERSTFNLLNYSETHESDALNDELMKK